jgi:2-polyprenyl-6-methoxyphenol hydroxylase-like FAD-dependent oxidoreductase
MADRERGLRDGIRAWPELAEIVGDAELAGPIRAVTSWHGFFHEATGPGWVLLGDAGQFKDPTPGQGISDSLRHAGRLADAIVGGLRGGPAAMDAQLHRWWKWRDRDSREMHWLATDLGSPGPVTPVREAVIADIASTPEGTEDFLGVLNHDIRPSKLFSAGRMVRAATRLVREQPELRGQVTREVVGLIRDNVRQARLDRPKPTPASRSRRPGVRRASRAAKAAVSALRS